jgi:calcineurin-like phosphoesterase family protein
MDYFVADLHFDHHRMAENRGFASTDDMNDCVLTEINQLVLPKQDRLRILGDFCWGDPAKWRQRIKCKNIMLILGNHDNRAKCVTAFGKQNVRDTYMPKVEEVPCFLSHYPHAYWPSSHYGSYHLYGHVHDMRTETITEAFPGIRSLDVGVDSAKRLLGDYRPFSAVEVHQILRVRPGHDPVQWYTAHFGKY